MPCYGLFAKYAYFRHRREPCGKTKFATIEANNNFETNFRGCTTESKYWQGKSILPEPSKYQMQYIDTDLNKNHS